MAAERRTIRVPVSCHAQIQFPNEKRESPIGDPGTLLEGTIINFSLGGALVEGTFPSGFLNSALDRFKSASVPGSIQIRVNADSIAIPIRIVWYHVTYNSHPATVRLGVEFLAVSEQDRRILAEVLEHAHDQLHLSSNIPELVEGSTLSESDKIPFYGAADYKEGVVQKRVRWLSGLTNVKLKHLPRFTESTEAYRGNIENLIGISQTPVGIIGPLWIQGEFARGHFYVPLATTEGVLVHSFHRGARAITRAGGVNVRVLRNKLHVDPIFLVGGLADAERFVEWIRTHYQEIKEVAERTTRHGRLIAIDPKIIGNKIALRFSYTTGDAMGMNIATIATDKACKYIVESLQLSDNYYIRSNYSSDKKLSMHGLYEGYGKEVFAETTLPRAVVRLLQTTPEQMYRYYTWHVQASTHAGMIGQNGQVINGITALFLATGQDVAEAIHSSAAISSCEVTEDGSLFTSVYIPNLVVGTIGGGTHLGTARECLALMGCCGTDKVNKFAEIVAATALAGEISILAAHSNRTFVRAHEIFARQMREQPSCSD